MKVYWLETGGSLHKDALCEQGVIARQFPIDSASYRCLVDDLKSERGYVAEDEVVLMPDTPGLEQLAEKFFTEHSHAEDEVRFVLSGSGVFDVRSKDDRFMRIEMEAGDVLVVPKGRNHRFKLARAREIRCLRLFKEPAGWEAQYR